MSGEEHTETGTGWPDPAGPVRPSGPAGEPDPRPDAPDPDELSPLAPEVDPDGPADVGESTDRSVGRFGSLGAVVGGWRRVSPATVVILVLLALLGFTLVEQLRTTSTDPTTSAARQEDLVRILYDLDAREDRLRQDIAALEKSQRQLRSGEQGRQVALEEAARRADELGILAGTLPARGPGLTVRFEPGGEAAISAVRVLDAVQELRGAGAEAMQISGGDRATVRIVASTFFLDGENGSLVVGGRRLTGPYTITVIGDPATMRTALKIPGGVVATVAGDGGTVIVEDREVVEVSALHAPIELEHARPIT
ncbi:DUF881 domain-containing protein [Salinispora arenicola]|uniref:Membrane protein n=2 Tax=Salinispora arenicola TaxID=168697 RepID=A0A542XS36_SALAC|nr:DUF881 domain-containing protein [Salinispora arenicola]MCN0150849.1 DUF881 domain-containing protein [Salinispora arenicola]NIL43182.1 DUF881 domain-containing protein [Salinispora arenicola]NIL57172.1 DUF881 domain-containing protein [Salinispora arenicola]NIL62609.1 DUF881 domain-containing protein [Salinispora arenicola]TQL38622.1 uncharacterized protein YlxW (UPF0749 family) [Salinispora arenicola]